MGLFDRFSADKKREAAEQERVRREEEERRALAEKQQKEHEKLPWPKVHPFSNVRVKDDRGNERIAQPLADPLTQERKDEIGPMVFEPRMRADAVRFLSLQELIFVLTTIEAFNKAAPLHDFEENRRVVYNEVLSRVRNAEHIWVLIDLTTGYPYLDHEFVLIYSDKAYAHAAANVLASQFRRISVQGCGGEKEPTVAGFFELLFYMGVDQVLLDNGFYGARIDRVQVVAPPNVKGNDQLPPINPQLNFALCAFLSEIRWPVRYDKRDEILRERETRMWSLIRTSKFIVPMQQEGPAELVGDKLKLGKETKLRFPMMTGPDGKTYLPIFTDGPEFSRKFGHEGWNGASFQWKDVLSLIKERDGLIINPLSHKAVLTKERIARMEAAAALAEGTIVPHE